MSGEACRECGEPLSNANWYPSYRATGQKLCRLCSNTKNRVYCRTPVNRRARTRYQAKVKRGCHNYDELLLDTWGRCPICRLPFLDVWTEPAVDHCHASGDVRNLLCTKCNTGLGAFRDSPAIMIAAIDYLAAHSPPMSFLMRPETDKNPDTGDTAKCLRPAKDISSNQASRSPVALRS